jgi:hypothetical protein
MTLKIGDRVRFLNDVGGGIVTAFIDNKMVEVRTDDGFELPVLATELLRDATSGYGIDGDDRSSSSNSENIPVRQQPEALKTEDYQYVKFKGEAFLAIVPENEKLLHVSDFKVYLINDSNYSVNYILSQTEGKVHEFIRNGILGPDSKLFIKKYGQSSLGKIKSFRLQAFFSKEGLFDLQPALDAVNSLEGYSFYKASEFKENDYFNSKAVVFKHEKLDMEEVVKNLSENDILKVKRSKDIKAAEPIRIMTTELEEIDLHIEEIVDSHTHMSNGEIIEIQMARFETALETAINSKTKKIVFIHGVGNGKLKHELRTKLERKYPNLKYQDASFKEYGYGATLVNLK